MFFIVQQCVKQKRITGALQSVMWKRKLEAEAPEAAIFHGSGRGSGSCKCEMNGSGSGSGSGSSKKILEAEAEAEAAVM